MQGSPVKNLTKVSWRRKGKKVCNTFTKCKENSTIWHLLNATLISDGFHRLNRIYLSLTNTLQWMNICMSTSNSRAREWRMSGSGQIVIGPLWLTSDPLSRTTDKMTFLNHGREKFSFEATEVWNCFFIIMLYVTRSQQQFAILPFPVSYAYINVLAEFQLVEK